MNMSKETAEGICKIVAIVGLNGLAAYYDSQFLYFALGADALLLGLNIMPTPKKKVE